MSKNSAHYNLGKHWKVSKETRKKHCGKKNCLGKHWKIKDTSKMRGRKGELSPTWKGGISFKPYTLDWTETLKKSIRERDHYICQLCNEYGFVVHHIDYDKENSRLENLITLCRKCHTKTNHNRIFWMRCFWNLLKFKLTIN